MICHNTKIVIWFYILILKPWKLVYRFNWRHPRFLMCSQTFGLLQSLSCYIVFMVICLDPVSSLLVLSVNIKFCSVACLLNLTKLSATRFKDLIVFCEGCARQNGKVTRSLPLLSTMKKTVVKLRLISLTLSCDACVKRPVYFHH